MHCLPSPLRGGVSGSVRDVGRFEMGPAGPYMFKLGWCVIGLMDKVFHFSYSVYSLDPFLNSRGGGVSPVNRDA